MRINATNLSIVVGTNACDAHCPFCVAKMTPEATLKADQINWRNFDKACQYARDNHVSTVLLTGKGEPTLFPDLITSYLHALRRFNFPFIELQTNGNNLELEKYRGYLEQWKYLGLSLVSLSVVGSSNEKSNELMGVSISWKNVLKIIRGTGLSFRLSVLMAKGYADTWMSIENLIMWCKAFKAEQLTLRRIGMPEKTSHPRGKEIADWVEKHMDCEENIEKRLESEYPVLKLPHGATVYDIGGQNVCYTECLTSANKDEIRQLIFFPDGHLRYDWAKEGAILL